MSFKEEYIKKIFEIIDAEKDESVNYYSTFCIVCENENGEQLQLNIDYEDLLDLAQKLKPYLTNYEDQIERDKEDYEAYKKMRI